MNKKCTYFSCSIFYKPGTGIIHCPYDEGYLDAKTGDVIVGPPLYSL
ncbi:hypothetical protein [Flavobacterium sp. 7A]|nr:hypothetical protein [Flavobacterium sp. 7A]MCW2119512.1 hypothetical protein [Flavobacterium sp. 7A]